MIIDIKNLAKLENLDPEQKLQVMVMVGIFGGIQEHIKDLIDNRDEGAELDLKVFTAFTAVLAKSEEYNEAQPIGVLEKCGDAIERIIDAYSKRLYDYIAELNK